MHEDLIRKLRHYSEGYRSGETLGRMIEGTEDIMDEAANAIEALLKKLDWKEKTSKLAQTKKKLSQLYWLNREIAKEKRRLQELEAAENGCEQKITGLPHIGAGDVEGNIATLIAEQKDLIKLMKQQSVIEYNRLNRYISGVEDAQMRMILSLRYVDGLSWNQVALHIGGDNTSDSVRKAHERFLKLSVLSASPMIQ